MKEKELLKLIYELEGELDNAWYTLPEYQNNSEGRDYVDSARNTLYELKEKLEKIITNGTG